MKEWLTARGVDFASIDVTTDPDGLDGLAALGVTSLPILALGDRHIPGVNLSAVADLLGLEHDDRPELAPAELVDRLRRVLSTTLRLAGQIPTGRFDDTVPGRDRTYLGLVNHIVQIPVGFLEVAAGAPLDAERASAEPSRTLALGELAQRVGRIRTDLARWADGIDPLTVERSEVETFAGPQTLHQVLERTTGHTAQHCRQMHRIVEHLGLEADDPLTNEDLRGLPVPAGTWDG